MSLSMVINICSILSVFSAFYQMALQKISGLNQVSGCILKTPFLKAISLTSQHSYILTAKIGGTVYNKLSRESIVLHIWQNVPSSVLCFHSVRQGLVPKLTMVCLPHHLSACYPLLWLCFSLLSTWRERERGERDLKCVQGMTQPISHNRTRAHFLLLGNTTGKPSHVFTLIVLHLFPLSLSILKSPTQSAAKLHNNDG